MIKLNFPEFNFRFKNSENKRFIFDIIRKKFVRLQPEEWVRQNTLHYLIEVKHYPMSLINIEKKLTIGKLTKRYDIVVFKPDGSIQVLVECKAPEINITQETFDQIAQYNQTLKAPYLMLTNGLNHYVCITNNTVKSYHFIKSLPNYEEAH